MGFFDRFTRTIDEWSDFVPRREAAMESLEGAWGAAKDAAKESMAMQSNLIGTVFPGTDAKERADAYWASRNIFDRSLDQVGRVGAVIGGPLGALGEAPVFKQAFALADAAQRELVGRPLATANLVRADAVNERNLGMVFEGDTWREAYNTTTYVTPGQAWTFATASNVQDFWEMVGIDPSGERRREILEQHPTLGLIVQDPKEFDPRIRGDARNQYYDNTLMKGVSGTLDTGIVLVGDPTIVAGKLGGMAKLRYLSKEMNAAALSAGRLEGVVTGTPYRKAKDFVRNADNSEVVRRRMFNNHYDGDMASALLFDAARMQDEYATRGGTVDLYDTTFRALYGDVHAWDTLAHEAPRLADVVGHERANYTIANAAQLYGQGNPRVDAKADKLRETKRRAWVDATVNGHGMWGQLGTATRGGGLLTGTHAPRLTWTSAWRTGAHSFLRNTVPQNFGHWARRSRYFLPSQRAGRMLDLNDPNSSGVFRETLSMSRLNQEELDRWVSAYSRATSADARFTIYNAAENFVYRKHAERYGLTRDELDKLVPVMNRYRRGNRQILQSNRRYASQAVAEEYEKKLRQRKLVSADRLARAKSEIDDAVKRGDMPSHHIELLDEVGNLNLIPEDLNLRMDRPVLSSQHGDTVPLVDWNVLENSLWWHAGFGRGKPKLKDDDTETWSKRFGRHVYGTQDITRAGLESVMSAWKVTAIIRPGYVIRTLSDEVGRIWAKQGAFESLATMGQGTKNVSHNMYSRGRLMVEAVDARRARGEGKIEVTAKATAVGSPSDKAGPARLSEDVTFDPSNPVSLTDTGKAYRSYERAFSDGVISLDDMADRVEAHATAGSLNPQLAEIWGSYEAGALNYDQFRKRVAAYALHSSDRAAYLSPAWGESLLRTVQRSHGRKKPGELARTSVVDPFMGDSPDLTPDQIKSNIASRHARVIRRGEDGQFNPGDVRTFVEDNLDELLKPDSLLGSHVWPDGRINLFVGKNLQPDVPIKETGGVRVGMPWTKRQGDLLRDSGTAEVTFRTAAGDATIRAGFEGDHGDRFRQQASNRGPDEAWVDAQTDLNFADWKADSGRWVDVGPDDWTNYKTSWVRAVKRQLGNDPVARQFLQGKSYQDVLKWMFNTSEGRAYHWKLGPWRSQFAEQVSMVQSMVDVYIPFRETVQDASFELRRKVLSGDVTIRDLENVVPRHEMPYVHGAQLEMGTGRGVIMDKIKKRTDEAFKWLSDLPNDKLVRYPFAAQRYKLHAKQLAERRGEQLAGRGDTFKVEDLRAIERTARSRALRDVQRYLFQTNATWDFAKAARLFIPFGSALADSGLKWGLVLRENPGAMLHIWKAWNAPERNGLVTDQDGNQLEVEEGEEVWYSVNPDTGERTRLPDHQSKDRFITFRLPSFLSERYYGEGVQPQVRINKRVVQTFLDVPTAGPVVAVPANQFALENPEFSENKFVKQWILPLGPSADVSSRIIPTNVQNVRRQFSTEFAEQDRLRAEAQTTAIFAAEMTSYTLGERPNPPTFEEAREKAASMRGLRFFSAFVGGISPQIQSPYQPYIDYYRQLRVQEAELRRQAADQGRDQSEVPAADQQFYEEMGPEFFNLTARVTRNTAGIPATIQTHKAYKKYQDLIDKHPEIASLIIGQEGAGEFSRAVYEAQKLQELRPGSGEKMRKRLAPEESWEDVQRRKGWLEYHRFQDTVTNDLIRLGLDSVNDVGAERVKANRDRFIAEREFIESPWGETVLNPWFQDFRTVDTSRMKGRLHSLRSIIQDRRLQGRDDIRGLVEYLQLRDRFTAFMDRQGFATLDSEQAATLRVQWNRMVFQLVERSPSFAALYDRWLTGDESLEARG